MNYQVKIGEKTYQVKILDLVARPVRVEVDGALIEVYPEAQSQTGSPPAKAVERLNAQPAPVNGSSPVIHAPIPGVILSVAVATGDSVNVGQVLCVLEAMKMKNVIRAPRPGKIGKVYVQTGSTVKHHDPLIAIED